MRNAGLRGQSPHLRAARPFCDFAAWSAAGGNDNLAWCEIKPRVSGLGGKPLRMNVATASSKGMGAP